CSNLALLESSRTKVLRPHPPGEMPVGTDGVKSAECPTNVKEVMARFAHGLWGGGSGMENIGEPALETCGDALADGWRASDSHVSRVVSKCAVGPRLASTGRDVETVGGIASESHCLKRTQIKSLSSI